MKKMHMDKMNMGMNMGMSMNMNKMAALDDDALDQVSGGTNGNVMDESEQADVTKCYRCRNSFYKSELQQDPEHSDRWLCAACFESKVAAAKLIVK